MRRTRLRRVGSRGLTHTNLHKLWRDVLIAQRGKRCEAAGQGGTACTAVIQAHHIYPKGTYPALRYETDNGLLTCSAHHGFWLHTAPANEVGPWLERTCGADRLLRLQVRAAASKGARPRRPDLAAVRLMLEQELATCQRSSSPRPGCGSSRSTAESER